MTDATPTPLPCPYCGSESIYIRMGDGGRIRCFPNGCTISPWCDTEAEAVTRWNAVASLRTRAELAEGDRDRLREACDVFRADVLHGIDGFDNHETNAILGLFDVTIGNALDATDLKSERKDVTT